jgi:predicted nucleotidyltransferase
VTIRAGPFGLSNKDWVTFEDTVLRPLKALGAEVWIFGSRARGTQRLHSDIDVLFHFPSRVQEPVLNLDARLYEIKSNAEDSNLSVKVDLVNERNLAVSYREAVLRERVSV